MRIEQQLLARLTNPELANLVEYIRANCDMAVRVLQLATARKMLVTAGASSDQAERVGLLEEAEALFSRERMDQVIAEQDGRMGLIFAEMARRQPRPAKP